MKKHEPEAGEGQRDRYSEKQMELTRARSEERELGCSAPRHLAAARLKAIFVFLGAGLSCAVARYLGLNALFAVLGASRSDQPLARRRLPTTDRESALLRRSTRK